jgi:hypothetical protein
MEVGQPSAPRPAPPEAPGPPSTLGDRLHEALGIAPLRERIAGTTASLRVAVAPERVVCDHGLLGRLRAAFLSLFDAGAGRITARATGYRNILRALGIEPVTMPSAKATAGS